MSVVFQLCPSAKPDICLSLMIKFLIPKWFLKLCYEVTYFSLWQYWVRTWLQFKSGVVDLNPHVKLDNWGTMIKLPWKCILYIVSYESSMLHPSTNVTKWPIPNRLLVLIRREFQTRPNVRHFPSFWYQLYTCKPKNGKLAAKKLFTLKLNS